ncbi:hypothetical protein A0J61_04122 [Choanephora cucurbitarum]|uniref:C3HC-type domain-containing protein n=1 Tax=Choanephora cucurbitarum TaxID=101091 RepID=A0A1C7NFF8_9FUNG|nr:hypothetical protein A0J61_04122 [Choanephora cucurbitarum]
MDDDLRKEAQELRDLVARIRKETRLLPTLKRPRETDKEEIEAEKPVKVQKTVWDSAGLMTRLKTFNTLYHCAPRPISALDGAKHGWRHKATQEDATAVLGCEDCSQTMYVIEIPIRYQHKPEAIQAISYYKKGLLQCHQEDCPWRYHGCKSTTYTFPLTTLLEGLDRLRNEARSFMTVASSIPTLKHPLSTEAFHKLKFVVSHFEKTEEIDAYLLSLFGWTLLHPDLPGIQCDLCFSQKGFFQLDKLDVLEEHKPYCPWRTGEEEQSGYEWMMGIVSMEYNLLIKRQDLSLASDFERTERFYRLKQTMLQSEKTLLAWQARIEAVAKSKEPLE